MIFKKILKKQHNSWQDTHNSFQGSLNLINEFSAPQQRALNLDLNDLSNWQDDKRERICKSLNRN